jgi:hypothetical protein
VCLESVRGLDNYYNTCSQLQQHLVAFSTFCANQQTRWDKHGEGGRVVWPGCRHCVGQTWHQPILLGTMGPRVRWGTCHQVNPSLLCLICARPNGEPLKLFFVQACGRTQSSPRVYRELLKLSFIILLVMFIGGIMVFPYFSLMRYALYQVYYLLCVALWTS